MFIIKIIYICNLPIIPPIGFTNFNIKTGYTFLDYKGTGDQLQISEIENGTIITEYSVLYYAYNYSYIFGDKNINDSLKNDILENYKQSDKLHIPSGGKILQ